MNAAVRDGSIAEINERLIASTKPEAAYFGTENSDDLERGLAEAAAG